MKSGRTPLGNVLLGFLAFGGTILLAEFGCRLLLPPPIAWRYPQPIFETDPELGHHLVPNQSTFTHSQPVATNSLGFRDSEYQRQIPTGARRVLALGDSQTFGNGLALDDTWPKQLQRILLERRSAHTWQVLNAGVPATSTWHHGILLRRALDHYEVDLVLLAVYVNDVHRRSTRPPFDVERRNAWRQRIKLALKRSTLVSLVNERLSLLLQRLRPDRGAIYETGLLTGAEGKTARAGWDQVEKSLAEMKNACIEHGAGFALLVLPRRDQVDGSQTGTAFNRRVADLASRLGLVSIDALPSLRAAYARHGRDLFIAWDGHNSALANRILADLMESNWEALSSPLLPRPIASSVDASLVSREHGPVDLVVASEHGFD